MIQRDRSEGESGTSTNVRGYFTISAMFCEPEAPPPPLFRVSLGDCPGAGWLTTRNCFLSAYQEKLGDARGCSNSHGLGGRSA